jgi:RHS repeat-associated protein
MTFKNATMIARHGSVSLMLWNGNITAQKWKTTNKANTERAYCYQYDSLNRIKSADYGVTGAWKTTLAYDEDSVRYDENGNIRRYMRRNQSGVLMDDMTYNYFGTGNRLAYISDKNNENFPKVDGTVPQYYYDANGNLASDKYKNDTILYNLLNLPRLINIGSNRHTNYVYTATGEKIQASADSANTIKSKQYYAGNMVYDKNLGLSYILMDEGRIVLAAGKYNYEYNVKDHLGNVRMVLDSAGNALQETHYYPFGLEMAGIGTSSSTNKYLYNGKEKQTEFGMDWLDYGARMYDPIIGRTPTFDPQAEKYYSMSAYSFLGNNPILYIDPTGEELYLFYYTTGNTHHGKPDEDADKAFLIAALTRALDIVNSNEYNSEEDHIVIKGISDLGKLKEQVEGDINTWGGDDGYGTTKEVGIWSHSGFDGPTGSKPTSGENALDGNNMKPEGWSQIHYNWSEKGAKLGFYGCRSGKNPEDQENKQEGTPFVQKVSSQANTDGAEVWGQTQRSYPSPYTNYRHSTLEIHFGSHHIPTYYVGSIKGAYVGALSHLGPTKAYPLAVYKNGQFIGYRYQPGNKLK